MLLRAAVVGMLPTTWPGLPTAPSKHEGEVREASPALPWLVINIVGPDGMFRGEDAVRTSGRVTVTLTAAGRTEAEASLILRHVASALDGEQPEATGWNCGALIEHQHPRVYAADLDLPGASIRAFAGVVAYRFVATDLPSS